MSTLQCSYCSLDIVDERFLHCGNCGGDVHIKCFRHASTPGDLLGDVFFDFTCSKCVQPKCEKPSTSKVIQAKGMSNVAVGEKFIRQRMPWLLIITLALYNLSIKSKGLSRQGYFHWRTHIVNFIDKNWDYLFDRSVKRRKKWTGSISGALSHNSPKYFTSGLELFEETGWWKLTYENKSPKYIFNLYEKDCLKRQQIRQDKRQQDDSYASDTSTNDNDVKRLKRNQSDDELLHIDSCSRTIPYMGRKPKVAKPLNILDDDLLIKCNTSTMSSLEDPVMPLNTVQSSLMDFLAESLASDDLNMFNSLPNIVSEPLVDSVGKNDILPLLESHNDNASILENPSSIKTESMDLNGQLYSEFNAWNGKLKDIYTKSSNFLNQANFNNPVSSPGEMWRNQQEKIQQFQNENTLQKNSEFITNEYDEENSSSSNLSKGKIHKEDEEEEQQKTNSEEDSDLEEYKPRIVQIINFQQLATENQSCSSMGDNNHPKNEQLFKRELVSDTELEKCSNGRTNTTEDDENVSDNDICTTLRSGRISLFTKLPKRRWPWLVDNRLEDIEDDLEEKTNTSNNAELVLMSVYEEKELLQKLRKIFYFEEKLEIHIPPYIRRFYRKLCIREWKREHGKPIFNLDDYVDDRKHRLGTKSNVKANILERYHQLISLSSSDAKKSFYARIAGSSEYEMFESPYTQRILHPFIYRDRKCFPPFLKLMCELQYKVNGNPPSRAPIDFCYVRPNHIAAVNALLQIAFWPGIDMSECLSYPDFSVVALYKNLIIGCGFLVPDVGFNEAYISFMAVRPGWQRSGIATFMLYHLIQTCMTKDITLHVSATNPAVFLYQKFGFKIEEIILNFYEKYLPFDSRHSRNAFFLRLTR